MLDEPLAIPESTPDPLKIFDSKNPLEQIPEGFNAGCVSLDGRLKADIDWKVPRQQALALIETGCKVFWEMDLGLFNRLDHPVDHLMQFEALSLSLEHFRNTLWQEFQDTTAGVCLYRGPADFSGQISSDAASEYLSMLANRMPDALPLFTMLDVSHVEDPGISAQLVRREKFNRIHLLVKGHDKRTHAYGWEDTAATHGYIGRQLHPLADLPPIAFCLPNVEVDSTSYADGLSQAMREMTLRYRVIAEMDLITEWEGLDYLIFAPQALSGEGKRKLKGFCAAGGTAVTLGEKIGLAQELNFKEFNEESPISLPRYSGKAVPPLSGCIVCQ